MSEQNTESSPATPSEAEQLTVDQAIANLKQTEDLGLRYYAAWWLGKFRVNEAEAIEALLAAMEDEEDRTPDGGYPLRRNAATALGKLGDTQAVEPLIRCLDCPDFYVRESAAQALEMIGDATAIPPLKKMLDGGLGEAVQVAGKPHLVQPYEAIIEALGTLNATEAIPLIEPFLEHFFPKVQYAAARALYQLTGNSSYGDILVQALERDELQLRRSALMDLGAIGYVAAGEAIAETPVANSLRLIALKGLLERTLSNGSVEFSELSPESLKIMGLMDTLL